MKLTLNEDQQDDNIQKLMKLQSEKPSFKELEPKKKVEFIFDYYKWRILAVIAIIVSLATLIPAIVENKKDVALYAAFINTQMSDSNEDSPLMDAYQEEKEIDVENKRLVLDCSISINYTSTSTTDMESSQKMLAMFASSTMDVVVQDENTFVRYSALNGYLDLNETLSEEYLELYGDYLLYTEGEDGGQHAYGIDVSDSPVLKEYEAYIVPAVFTICTTTEQVDNAIAFLDYLMGN